MEDNSESHNWESLRQWTLESVAIDKVEEPNAINNHNNINDNNTPPPPQNQPLPPLPKSGSKNTFNRIASNFKGSKRDNGAATKVVGGGPRFGRQQSGALRGLNSLRFLDKQKIGKEGDRWKAVEKRFNQMAVDGRLSRDKFGICVGIYFYTYISCKTIFLFLNFVNTLAQLINF